MILVANHYTQMYKKYWEENFCPLRSSYLRVRLLYIIIIITTLSSSPSFHHLHHMIISIISLSPSYHYLHDVITIMSSLSCHFISMSFHYLHHIIISIMQSYITSSHPFIDFTWIQLSCEQHV